MTAIFSGALIVTALLAMRWILNEDGRENLFLYRLGVGAALLLSAIFAITSGEFYAVLIVAMASIPLIPQLSNTLKTLPVEGQFIHLFGDKASPDEMSRTQALSILGLSGNPSSEEIKKAHKSLIRKVHPDNGGSDYLSHQVNQARDILLNS